MGDFRILEVLGSWGIHQEKLQEWSWAFPRETSECCKRQRWTVVAFQVLWTLASFIHPCFLVVHALWPVASSSYCCNFLDMMDCIPLNCEPQQLNTFFLKLFFLVFRQNKGERKEPLLKVSCEWMDQSNSGSGILGVFTKVLNRSSWITVNLRRLPVFPGQDLSLWYLNAVVYSQVSFASHEASGTV